MSNRIGARAVTATDHTIKIVRRDVVEEAEPRARRVIRHNYAAALKNSVVIHCYIDRPTDDLQKFAVCRLSQSCPSLAVDVIDQVVFDQNSLRWQARACFSVRA